MVCMVAINLLVFGHIVFKIDRLKNVNHTMLRTVNKRSIRLQSRALEVDAKYLLS